MFWLDEIISVTMALIKMMLWVPCYSLHTGLHVSMATICFCRHELKCRLSSFSKARHLKTNCRENKALNIRWRDDYEAFSSLQWHWWPFMPPSSSVFQTNDTQKLTSTPTQLTHFYSTSLQYSKPLQAMCRCNFRPTRLEAVRRRALRDSSLMLLQSVFAEIY